MLPWIASVVFFASESDSTSNPGADYVVENFKDMYKIVR